MNSEKHMRHRLPDESLPAPESPRNQYHSQIPQRCEQCHARKDEERCGWHAVYCAAGAVEDAEAVVRLK